MDDLISRQAAIDALWKIKDDRDSVYYTSAIHSAVDTLKQLPSAQPERKTGKWNQIISIPNDMYGRYYCSECGKEGNPLWYFCPNCGADMRPQFEEPEINPCRGCEDYDGEGGCKTKGGCADRIGEQDDSF